MGLAHGSPATQSSGQVRTSIADAGPTTVWLRGDQDLSTSAGLLTMIDEAMASGVGDVVIDLSAVSFMDAGTIGHIVRAANRLAMQSRVVVVRRPSEPARRVLQICGLLGLAEDPDARDATSSGP
jgi:anti-anti-sigma factor